jgi:hypothetical protein
MFSKHYKTFTIFMFSNLFAGRRFLEIVLASFFGSCILIHSCNATGVTPPSVSSRSKMQRATSVYGGNNIDPMVGEVHQQ